MGILKKLKLNKKYLIMVDKNYFLTNILSDPEFEGIINKIEEEKIICYSNKKYEVPEVVYYNRYNIIKNKILSKHLIGIITFLLILIILTVSKNFIREIQFENKNYYSQEIYDEVVSHLVKKGPFYVLDDNISNISQELRNKFPEFAWLGLTRYSSKIIINVEKQDVPIKQQEDLSITGDLIASKDAIITDIIVNRGIVLVMKNQSVKKGDVLVSGNLRYNNDPSDKTNLVKSKGIIIGNTIGLEKIKVPIKTSSLEYSGKIINKKYVEFLGSLIGKTPKTFDIYKTDKQDVFNLFNFFKIINLTYYELVEVINEYDEKSASEYAKTLIKKDLEQNRVSPLERVESINIVDITLEDGYYIVSMIVKRYQNIGVFIQH